MAWQIPRIFARASVFVLGMAMIAALTLGMPTSADARSAGAGPVVGHGPTWRGLSLRATGRCAGGFRIDGTGMCSHGPDTRLGLSRAHAATRRALAGAGPAAAAAATSVSCDGDGVSGARVQAIYAHGPSTASRYATLLQSPRGYAADVENVFLQSAEETGGVRRPRWVTDAQCQVSVIEVGLSANAESSFNQTITELQALGYDQPGRKYLIWFDAAVYCGIGTWWSDDQANQDNLSNTATGFARADASCWDWAEAHELMHTLGGVQNSAPHSSSLQGGYAHCTDEYDLMCYPDAAGVHMDVVCDASHTTLFDCGHNDYFHTAPAAGSYLATHWNTADSAWLATTTTHADLAPPVLRLKAGSVIDATGAPTTVTVSSSANVAGAESVDLERQQDAGPWGRVGSYPAATTQAAARLPDAHTYRFRTRIVDPSGDPGAWVTGAAARVLVRQENARAIAWAGSWTRSTDRTALGGATRWSTSAGSTAAFTTTATDLALVASRGPDRGIAEIFVDGTSVATLDLGAATLKARRTVFVRHFDTAGRHTLVIRVTGTHGASSTGNRVDLDALVLLAAES